MVKQLAKLSVVGLFMLAVCGPALAAAVSGTVSAIERGGRQVTVKGNDGKEVKVRVSNSSTELMKGGKPIDRGDIKVGNKVKAEYDENDDRKTASKIEVQ